MGDAEHHPDYPIAAVSKLTGIGCHSLRVWERRYGFPVPHRIPSGHRRYSRGQVLLLRRIAERVRDGDSVGEVIRELRESNAIEAHESHPDVATPGESTEQDPTEQGPSTHGNANGNGNEVSGFLDAMVAGDLQRGRSAYDALAERLGTEALIQRVIAPAFVEAGERWFQRTCTIYQEHVISGFLRRKLDGLIEQARQAAPPGPAWTAILGTVQGDRHEGGVLIVELLLQRAGWRVINLGVDLPVEQYRRAVQALRPDALAISFVLSRSINKRFEELSRIREVPVFVGGRSILNYQSLARRYGLIPVAGPAERAIEIMAEELERREKGPALRARR